MLDQGRADELTRMKWDDALIVLACVCLPLCRSQCSDSMVIVLPLLMQ